MPVEILMPALSPTMTEGKIAKWVKAVGDSVKSGDVLAEIETDKATMEVEAVDEGILAKIMVPEGSEHVAVNTPIALIAGEGENAAEIGKADAAAATPAKAAAPEAPAAKSAPAAAAQPVAALAAEHEWTGKTQHMTVRDALRDAMAEEMRRDETVF